MWRLLKKKNKTFLLPFFLLSFSLSFFLRPFFLSLFLVLRSPSSARTIPLLGGGWLSCIPTGRDKKARGGHLLEGGV